MSETFDCMVIDYLNRLLPTRRGYAAHYAHHVQAGTPQDVTDQGWPCPARARRQIRKDIDALATHAEQQDEDRAVRAEEDRIEDGQSRWSETGSTRRER